MAQQLIFTSTPQGLEPGRTGYCTVARHKDLRHRLVRELERLSVYDFGQQVGGNKVDISIYRKIALGSEEFFVLSKICDAGLDYTNRTNYLAHHLVLDGFEIATCPSPAEIFLNWNGWKRKWEDGPRYLTPGEEVTLTDFKSKGLVPCKNWLSFTNDPGNAATLVSPGVVKPIVLENVPAQSTHLLQLFAESCALLKISLDAWDYSFTTFLQGNDDARSFAWLGIEGQPAGERLKQSDLRNYIDLQNWTSSAISDEVDMSLSHIARKGPTAPPTKRVKKGASSVTRSPLSHQQVQQIKGEGSAYLSTSPSGSTVKAQEASTKKEKKKRPWLLQLAVISTALCLLGALIVGLAYNLGDWFNKDGSPAKDEPIITSDDSQNVDVQSIRPVIQGSYAQLDQIEYLKISQKHPYLRWVSLDVGGKEPLKIKIKDDQFDRFEKALDQSDEGDELKVVITEEKGELTFDQLAIAPQPKDRGRAKEITFEGEETIAITREDDHVSFVVGDDTFSYDLRKVKAQEANRLTKLTELLQSGQKIPLNLRVEDSRVVYIEPFELPGDKILDEPTVKPSEPAGRLIPLKVKGAGSAYFEPQQMRIQLPVNGTERKAYTFRESEADKMRSLYEFLEKGEEQIDLNIRLSEDGNEITFLDFELPEEKPVESITSKILSPLGLRPVKKMLFWVPGVQKNGNWKVDDSRKSFIYNDVKVANFLLSYFQENSRRSGNPITWMTDYQKGELFSPEQFKNEALVEEFTYEYKISQHPLDPVKIASISFTSGNSYSFDFEITEGKCVEISYNASHAWNSLNRGKIIRLPLASESGECVDLLLLSNQHASLDKKSKIGQNYSLTQKEIFIDNQNIAKELFTFLSVEGQSLHLSLSVMDSTPHVSKVYFRKPTWRDFIDTSKAKLSGLPTALIQLDENLPFKSKVSLDLDYFRTISDDFLKEKQKCDDRLSQLGAGFPDPEIYKNLEQYGSGSKELLVYQPGTSFGSYAYNLPLLFIQKNFDWDDVRFKNLRGQLELIYNNQELVTAPKLLLAYWTRLASEVEKFIFDSVQKDFNYQEDKALRDAKLLFDFLSLLLRTEKALGVGEENLLTGLQGIRANLASPLPEKPFGLLSKEILSLSSTNPQLSKFLKSYHDNYRELQRILIPSSKLNLKSLSLATSTISDLGKNSIYKQKEKDIRQNQFWSQAYGSINQEILKSQDSIIKGNSMQTAERFKKIISEIPWTLAVYSKDTNDQWKKQSDFLRLAPPANF
ncbi:MAG: hypothetical protein HOI70_05705 [Opitutae bacterium]|nr:hypothetical protein [Opitutae bacterium]